MPLSVGNRLGPYEILAPIGSGGMGQVYRARDSRLGRDVAIKICDERFSERFEREARAISSLNHPNICALHDVGQQDGGAYLVMEYIEGRPLEGPLPLSKALEYAGQILDALDAAHRQGIVHRDLKPANILITRNGVKLLDFGLAKRQAKTRAVANPDETATMALTGEHTIVGTPQYMAPEQIEGREVDARTDIFAFGSVLYEMLTGKRAFEGKTPSLVMAAVLAAEPAPISKLQPLTPPSLEQILRTCLEKDPERRWQSARDLRRALGLALEERPAVPPSRARRWWAVAALLLILGLGLGWIARNSREPVGEARSFQLQVSPPAGAEFRSGYNSGGIAISPDGRLLAFVANLGPVSRLWVRPLDSLKARELPGTDGAAFPFWSPDSRSIGFFAEGKLKRIEASGGPATLLASAPLGRGGTWNANDVIVFGPASAGPLRRISASGGTPAPATDLDAAGLENSHRWPQFLPDGNRFLYFIRSANPEITGVYLGSLDRPREKTRVLGSGVMALFAQGLGNHPDCLLSVQDGSLVAQPFDSNHARFTGPAVPLAEAVGIRGTINLADFSISKEGTLFYGTGTGERFQLAWLNREGRELGSLGPSDRYLSLRVSPDGKRVLVSRTDSKGLSDLWLYEFARATLTRFTFSGGGMGTWSPDGKRIAFTNPALRLFLQDASGARPEERLTQSPNSQFINDWSPDGRFLLFMEVSPATQNDLWLAPVVGESQGRSLSPDSIPGVSRPFLA